MTRSALVSGYIRFLSRVVSSFSNRVILRELYHCISPVPNLKYFLQLKFFWAKHDKPQCQENKGREFFIICHI